VISQAGDAGITQAASRLIVSLAPKTVR